MKRILTIKVSNRQSKLKARGSGDVRVKHDTYRHPSTHPSQLWLQYLRDQSLVSSKGVACLITQINLLTKPVRNKKPHSTAQNPGALWPTNRICAATAKTRVELAFLRFESQTKLRLLLNACIMERSVPTFRRSLPLGPHSAY